MKPVRLLLRICAILWGVHVRSAGRDKTFETFDDITETR